MHHDWNRTALFRYFCGCTNLALAPQPAGVGQTSWVHPWPVSWWQCPQDGSIPVCAFLSWSQVNEMEECACVCWGGGVREVFQGIKLMKKVAVGLVWKHTILYPSEIQAEINHSTVDVWKQHHCFLGPVLLCVIFIRIFASLPYTIL